MSIPAAENKRPSPFGPDYTPQSDAPQVDKEDTPQPKAVPESVQTLKENLEKGVFDNTTLERQYSTASEEEKLAIVESILAEKPKRYGYLIVEIALRDSNPAAQEARQIISKDLTSYADELKRAYALDGTKKTEAQQRALQLLQLEENPYGRSPWQIEQLGELTLRANREQDGNDMDLLRELLKNIPENSEKIETLFDTTPSTNVKVRIIRDVFSQSAEKHKALLYRLVLDGGDRDLVAAAKDAVKLNASFFEGELKVLYRDCLSGEMGLEGDKQDKMRAKIEDALFFLTYLPQKKQHSELLEDLDVIKEWDIAERRRKLEEEATASNQE